MLWTVRGTVGYGGFYGRTVGFTVALRCGYRTVGLGWGRAFGAEATAGWVGEQRCRPHLKIEMGALGFVALLAKNGRVPIRRFFAALRMTVRKVVGGFVRGWRVVGWLVGS